MTAYIYTSFRGLIGGNISLLWGAKVSSSTWDAAKDLLLDIDVLWKMFVISASFSLENR